MPVDFTGIYEKLKRADENIRKLKVEIDHFLEGGRYPVMPDIDGKEWDEAVAYHRNKAIPVRFGVLAGETIHHFRSILDHIIWQFSSAEARQKHGPIIEFPVFKTAPRSEKELLKYNGKIQGITDRKVRRLVNDLQPYHAGNEIADHFIAVIHDMDRFDKHRELVIVDSSALVKFVIPGDKVSLIEKVMLQKQGKLQPSGVPHFRHALKNYAKITPQVALMQFGNREDEPVIPALEQLSKFVLGVVQRFATHIKRT